MKKTYVTTMPNHIGAFLQASRCFARLGVNITRVSYNKAVDSHTLFIDAEGPESSLRAADEELAQIGYLPEPHDAPHVILIEFRLRDEPGGVTKVLELIERFRFNISYISSQENGTEYQLFKMGLFVEQAQDLSTFLSEAEKLCQVRVINYNRSERVYDNSIFYNDFVSWLVESMGGTEDDRSRLMINANLAMQTLDEQGLSPYRTFNSISRFAELLSTSRGDSFRPRVTRHEITPDTAVTVIEPPCGSNTMIVQSRGETLFIDSGYACYEQEMLALLRRLLPEWDTMKKTILITHADVDHCGLLHLFDEVLCSRRSAECLRLEQEGLAAFREQNYLHKPYIQICKTLTAYRTTPAEKVRALWGSVSPLQRPLEAAGYFCFGELRFEVYEGQGGHLPGEIVLIDYDHRVAITGDVYVNVHDMTSEQKRYNRYAPILMTSVDTDPALCAQERKAVFDRLGAGKWQVFGAHGARKEYEVSVD